MNNIMNNNNNNMKNNMKNNMNIMNINYINMNLILQM